MRFYRLGQQCHPGQGPVVVALSQSFRRGLRIWRNPSGLRPNHCWWMKLTSKVRGKWTDFYVIVKVTDNDILQVKYPNNTPEQDDCFINQTTQPMIGFKVFNSAAAALASI